MAFPLHAACRDGDLNGVLARATGDAALEVDARDRRGRTPLWLAAERGHAEIVELLLDLGADANAANADSQETPLVACARGQLPASATWKRGRVSDVRLRTARALLDAGATVDRCTADRETPLTLAARAGDLELAALLLARGADVDGFLWDQSPLVGACSSGHVRMVQLLLDEGGEVSWSINKSMENLLFIASERGDHEMVALLLRYGASTRPGYYKAYPQFALHAAVAGGHVETVRLLLEAGADPEEVNFDCRCALQVAAEKGRVDVVNVLIEHGADPNPGDYEHITPLHCAAQQGHADVVARLLDCGARDCANYNGDTALLFALSANQVDVVQLLLARGCDNGIVRNNLYAH